MRIREIIDRDLERQIEEIVKVTQRDEAVVHGEITEYVVTPGIRKHYRRLLKAIAEGPSDPQEGIGIWLSGFFGSGKSAFAKNLGYILANPTVQGVPAAELMKRQLDDAQCAGFIDVITTRIPTDVVMFDVQVDRGVAGRQRSSIALYMYKALLRELDYAEDFHIAELEQGLEADGRLEEFVERFEAGHRRRFEADPERYALQLEREQWRWRVRRKMAHKINEASAVLHEMDPGTYPEPDSWARGLKGEIEITPAYLVDRTFELMARRRPGRPAAYIVDEVGAYVAQSIERIEDLRAVVEQLGKESRNRVLRREAVAPVWVLVTSQEKLDEIVEALDTKRVELARLRDRFRYEVDLAPTDIREVATARVLRKTAEGERVLGELFERYEGELNERLRLEESSRSTKVHREEFIRFYPYPPHFLDLSIDIMSGIRLQPGAARHLGGSNRTIIKQAFEMLTSERTRLAEEELGRLVTLDLVYELVEGNLASERTRDISEIARQFGADSWESRVAKVLTLLEFVRNLPRTEANVAAMLYDRLGAPSAVVPVREALEELVAAEFVRRTPEGFKLQSATEKGWSQKRNAVAPRPRDRNEILREVLREVFADAGIRPFRYRNLKSFRVGLSVDDVALEDGEIILALVMVEDAGEMAGRVAAARAQSREEGFRDQLFWVFALNPTVEHLVTELHRSRRIISEYDQLRAQGKIRPDESQLLEAEKQERTRLQGRLREKLGQALAGGTGIFRGEAREGATQGRSLAEVLRAALEWVIPDLYPRLELGAVNLTGKEVEQLLGAANLKGLPDVFHDTEGGLGLVRQEEDRWVPNVDAPTAREIFRFIKERTDYGESATGKDLERHFTGLGYGWSVDLVKLVTAVLLRAGRIEVIHQGRRHRDPGDPMVRKPLADTREFRKASFAPREAVGIAMLGRAADALEELSGETAEIEESTIAHDLKELIRGRRGELQELEAIVRAEGLPWLEELETIRESFDGILAASSDDCVRTLAEEHERLRERLGRVRRIADALAGGGLEAIRRARRVLGTFWPQLGRSAGEELADRAELLEELLESPELHEHLEELRAAATDITVAYERAYREAHTERYGTFTGVLDVIRESPEWRAWCPPSLDAEESRERCEPLLGELERLRCQEELAAELEDGNCPVCRASLEVMKSQVLAAEGMGARVREKLRELTRPPEVEQEVVRLREIWPAPVTNEEEMRELLKRLEERLSKALDQGRRIIVE